LEPIDVEVRGPSVVLSVRLDGDTARALHALARRRSRRLSDLMREAAASLLRDSGSDSPRYLVSGAGVKVTVGDWSAGSLNARPDQTHSWRPSRPTKAVANDPFGRDPQAG
jgi:hypothetical protein